MIFVISVALSLCDLRGPGWHVRFSAHNARVAQHSGNGIELGRVADDPTADTNISKAFAALDPSQPGIMIADVTQPVIGSRRDGI